MTTTPVTNGPEHVDVLIVGAGISGIGAAHSLTTQHPDKTFAILEARGATGGTWDLFRYPGIRSDSDLHTFSYEFKPWQNDKAIAGAEAILDYLRETASEYGIDSKIRVHHKVRSAAWSSAEGRWLVEVERTDTGEQLTISCGWFFCAGGTTATTRDSLPHSRAESGSAATSCIRSTGRRISITAISEQS